MGVDITARIGIGWIVTAEQREEMIEAALANASEDICVEDEFHFINGYTGDTDYFLGEWLSSVDAGEWEDLEGFSDGFDDEEFMRKYTEILRVCGQALNLDDWGPPKLYLINQLW